MRSACTVLVSVPTRRLISAGCGVMTTLWAQRFQSNPDSATMFNASASTTAGHGSPTSRSSSALTVSGARPSPGPITSASGAFEPLANGGKRVWVQHARPGVRQWRRHHLEAAGGDDRVDRFRDADLDETRTATRSSQRREPWCAGEAPSIPRPPRHGRTCPCCRRQAGLQAPVPPEPPGARGAGHRRG